MIETEIIITVYRKSDLSIIRENICKQKIQAPIYIIEYENHYQIKLASDYEQWELDTSILKCFPEYDFTTDLANGKKEIRLQIMRYQSEFSTDGWGRQIQNPLNEVKYLIKTTTNTPEKFNPKITVLFENAIQEYYINIVSGINKTTDEKGFLLLNYFKERDDKNSVSAEIFKDRLYKSAIDAFQSGFLKLQDIANNDFKNYEELQKKRQRDEQRIPRKIIRDFIKACNNFNIDEIVKNLTESVEYERRINWKTELKTKGTKEFIEFLKSANQDLCSKNLKIRSNWNFVSNHITIGVEFYPVLSDNPATIFLKHKLFYFTVKNNKIENIVEEK